MKYLPFKIGFKDGLDSPDREFLSMGMTWNESTGECDGESNEWYDKGVNVGMFLGEISDWLKEAAKK